MTVFLTTLLVDFVAKPQISQSQNDKNGSNSNIWAQIEKEQLYNLVVFYSVIFILKSEPNNYKKAYANQGAKESKILKVLHNPHIILRLSYQGICRAQSNTLFHPLSEFE